MYTDAFSTRFEDMQTSVNGLAHWWPLTYVMKDGMTGAVDDITKLVIRACQVLGDPELAHAWLNKPQSGLSGQVPKVLMVDAQGRTLVSRLLTTLEGPKLT